MTPRQETLRRVVDLVPYARNARTHSEQQIDQLCASIKRFGWTNPILVEGNDIVAGHGRLRAAVKLGLPDVPCIELAGLSEDDRRAYILADNKLAANAGWDDELLAAELGDLDALDYDLDVIGFGDAELKEIFAGEDEDPERYTRKFDPPRYQPGERKPEVHELVDHAKARTLAAEIRASTEVSDAERAFLLLAAERHTVFNFRSIADYYAHASAPVQALMERSGLVIIDLEAAIIGGFVQVGRELMAQYAADIAAEVPADVDA